MSYTMYVNFCFNDRDNIIEFDYCDGKFRCATSDLDAMFHLHLFQNEFSNFVRDMIPLDQAVEFLKTSTIEDKQRLIDALQELSLKIIIHFAHLQNAAKPVRVYNDTIKVGILCYSLDDLKYKISTRFGMDKKDIVVCLDDGTLIETEDYFKTVADHQLITFYQLPSMYEIDSVLEFSKDLCYQQL
ncbi:hypothetical protein SlGVgp035 [Spodoptera litura granulovirus]|uniref:CIDE-N domain-containing protein n=1 Tax=Spodoptera litura granulovirus TaxID=359919 RepID=A5IZN7_9BBAC|nr:hypothetical protein SlGVgp035 [Spodoptera litura granulovirus]ABQ51978.1 hypothetical protein SlGVgp035 [Spodoptera litura granulovirus]